MNKRKSVGRNNRKLTGGFTDEKKARWHLAILAGLLLFGLLPNTKILAHATSLYTASFANILAPNSITSTSSITVLNNGDVGIGVSPDTKLDVDGQIKIRGGSPQPSHLLASVDSSGLAEWVSPSAVSGGVGIGGGNVLAVGGYTQKVIFSNDISGLPAGYPRGATQVRDINGNLVTRNTATSPDGSVLFIQSSFGDAKSVVSATVEGSGRPVAIHFSMGSDSSPSTVGIMIGSDYIIRPCLSGVSDAGNTCLSGDILSASYTIFANPSAGTHTYSIDVTRVGTGTVGSILNWAIVEL